MQLWECFGDLCVDEKTSLGHSSPSLVDLNCLQLVPEGKGTDLYSPRLHLGDSLLWQHDLTFGWKIYVCIHTHAYNRHTYFFFSSTKMSRTRKKSCLMNSGESHTGMMSNWFITWAGCHLGKLIAWSLEAGRSRVKVQLLLNYQLGCRES